MNEDQYTINATIPAPSDHDQLMEMLRSLLAERFHLKVHNETRQTRVYGLVATKGRIKALALQEGASLKAPSNPNPDQVTFCRHEPSELAKLSESAKRAVSARMAGNRPHGDGRKVRIWLTFHLTPDIGGRSSTYDIDFLSELPGNWDSRLSHGRIVLF